MAMGTMSGWEPTGARLPAAAPAFLHLLGPTPARRPGRPEEARGGRATSAVASLGGALATGAVVPSGPPSARQCAVALALAAAAAVRWPRRARRAPPSGRTRLEARKQRRKKSAPRLLKSGFWQEGNDEDDLDIFEWISAEDLRDEAPLPLSEPRELAAFSVQEGMAPGHHAAPEYRQPPMKIQLQKGLKTRPPLDVDEKHDLARDIAEVIPDTDVYRDADVITSLHGLRILLGFVDGSLQEDMRAKGAHTHLRCEAAEVDLMRIARTEAAPGAIVLPTVWNWMPENMTNNTDKGALNRRSYDLSFERLATGKGLHGGPPSVREFDKILHYRVLEYKIGDLKLVVRVPVIAKVPSVDDEAMDHPGMGVELHATNRRNVGDLWDASLSSHYAYMKLADVGMVVRGIVDMGALIDIQEVTLEDLRLDRPKVVAEADKLVGRLGGLLRRIREVADAPGCKGRPLYLQYSDAELRVIAPRWDDDEDTGPQEEGGVIAVDAVEAFA